MKRQSQEITQESCLYLFATRHLCYIFCRLKMVLAKNDRRKIRMMKISVRAANGKYEVLCGRGVLRDLGSAGARFITASTAMDALAGEISGRLPEVLPSPGLTLRRRAWCHLSRCCRVARSWVENCLPCGCRTRRSPLFQRLRNHPEQAGERLADSHRPAVDHGDYGLTHVVRPGACAPQWDQAAE